MDVSGEFTGGGNAVDGTVVRTLTAEGDAALKALKPEPDYQHPAIVSTYDSIRVEIKASINQNGSTGEGTVFGSGTRLLSPKVDFGQENPTVIWE